MKVDWFKDLPRDQQEERKAMVRTAAPTLKVLRNIIKKRLTELESNKVNPANYDSPAWAYMQADINGSMRELTKLVELLDQEDT